MDKSGDRQPAPWDRRYSPATPGLSVELTTVAELRRRLGNDLLERPGRVFFHIALICTSGEGLHEVDFTPVVLQAGRVVHVRPGQVHRWRLARNYQATLIFFPDNAGLRAAGWPVGPRWFDLNDAELRRTRDVLRLMRQEMKQERSPDRRNRCLNAALQILIVNLGLDLPRHQDVAHLPKPYIELLNQFEDEPDWSRSVKDRARRLGYSQRTLTRACLAAAGRTAKQITDDRILLEAQRLLADSESQVSSVAAFLEFQDPANFSKFFRRLANESPASWRSRNRPLRGNDM